jgi:hypothetical protein
MRRQEPKVLVAFWALSDYASFSQRLNRKSAKAMAEVELRRSSNLLVVTILLELRSNRKMVTYKYQPKADTQIRPK